MKGIPEKNQHLFWEGQKLENRKKLSSYFIPYGATLFLYTDPDFYPSESEPVFYALPEDEIGAYAIRDDGTKEYLLFQTYDICMDWLGRDELCAGYERCFHKDGK